MRYAYLHFTNVDGRAFTTECLRSDLPRNLSRWNDEPDLMGWALISITLA